VRRLGALKGGEINGAKEVLANAIVALVHGQDQADMSFNQAKLVFRYGDAFGASLPAIGVTEDHWNTLTLPQIMKEYGLAKGTGEAARLLTAGVWINDRDAAGTVLTKGILAETALDGEAELKIGKKRRYLLVREA